MNSIKRCMVLFVLLTTSKHTTSENQLHQILDFTLTKTEGSGDECTFDSCEDTSWCNEKTGFCECTPGFYKTEEMVSCTKGDMFGGKLFLSTADVSRDSSLYNNVPTTTDVAEFLHEIYINTTNYLTVTVDGNTTTSDNTYSYDYILIYNPGSGVTEYYLKSTFSQYIYFTQKCSPDLNDQCPITMGLTNCLLKVTESINAVGSAEEVICDDLLGYCDNISSTCRSQEAVTLCSCNDGYVNIEENETACYKKLCLSDEDCNSPFGWCDSEAYNNIGKCNCMFGFEGQNCYSYWLFVGVVCGGVLLLVLIITLIVCCCKRSMYEKKKMEYQKNITKQNHYAELMMKNMEENKNGKRTRANVPGDQLKYDYQNQRQYSTSNT